MSRLCQSQPNPTTKVLYHWIVLYDWEMNNPAPFSIDIRDQLCDAIPESWYRKKWPDQIRQQKVKFDVFPNRVFSVFAKVEKGIVFSFNLI